MDERRAEVRVVSVSEVDSRQADPARLNLLAMPESGRRRTAAISAHIRDAGGSASRVTLGERAPEGVADR